MFIEAGAPVPKKQRKRKKSIRTPARAPRVTRAQTMEEWAAEQAERRIGAEVAAIEEQQRIYQRQLDQQAQRRVQQGQALAQYMQAMGFDSRIQGIYASAARDTAGLASGFSGELRSAASADAAEQSNMLSGTGQEGAVRNEGVGMGDVLYGVGGYIPAKTLGEQGAAFASDAALQPAFALRTAGEEAHKLLDEGQDEYLEFAKAIAEARSGKFEYQEELLSQRQEARQKDLEFRLERIDNERDFWLKKEALYLSQRKFKLAADASRRADSAEQRYRMETQGRDTNGEILPDYYQDKQGRVVPKGYKFNRNGVLVRAGGAGRGSRGGSKGLTANAKSEILQSTLRQRDDMIKDLPEIAKITGYEAALNAMGPTSSAGRQKLKALRSKVAKQLWDRYSGIATTPAARKALRKMIAQVIDQYLKSGGGGGSGLTAGLVP